MVLVQDAAGLRQIDLVLGLLGPGQGDQPVQIGAPDDVLRRGRGHGAQPVELALGRLARRRRHPGLVDLLLQLLDGRFRLVGRAELLLDRLELLAQDELALPLLHLVLDVLLDLAAQLHHLDLAGHLPDQAVQPLLHGEDLEVLLLVLRLADEERRRQVGEARGAVDVQERDADLLGGDRHERQHLADLILQALDQGLHLDRDLDLLLQETDFGDQVGITPDDACQADPLEARDQDADGAVRELQHLLDDGGRAHRVQVPLLRFVHRGVLLEHQSDGPVLEHDLVDEPDGGWPSDHQRGRQVREHDRVLERQDRQGFGQRARSTAPGLLRLVQDVQDRRLAFALLRHR